MLDEPFKIINKLRSASTEAAYIRTQSRGTQIRLHEAKWAETGQMESCFLQRWRHSPESLAVIHLTAPRLFMLGNILRPFVQSVARDIPF